MVYKALIILLLQFLDPPLESVNVVVDYNNYINGKREKKRINTKQKKECHIAIIKKRKSGKNTRQITHLKYLIKSS